MKLACAGGNGVLTSAIPGLGALDREDPKCLGPNIHVQPVLFRHQGQEWDFAGTAGVALSYTLFYIRVTCV